MQRRDFLKLAGALSVTGCASTAPSKARVVILGGGFGGATAAKYIRMWDPSIDVVHILKKGRLEPRSLKAHLDAERAPEDPKRLVSVHLLNWRFSGLA